MKNKTKAVKLPAKLAEAMQERDPGKPPGVVLLKIYDEYLELEMLAKAVTGKTKIKSASQEIADYITGYKNEVTHIKKTLGELKTMVEGLQIYLKKYSNGGQQ